MARDKYGLLWVGTEAGLLKFDGYNYKKYIPSLEDSSSISGRRIRDILYDSQDNLWIGTSKGLNLYDYQTDKFKRINLDTDGNVLVYDIFETKSGDMWVATNQGLKKITSDYQVETYTTFKTVDSKSKLFEKPRTIHEDFDSNIWIGTFNNGLLRVNINTNELTELPQSDSLGIIISIADYSDTKLLVGSHTDGIHVIDKRSGEKSYPNNVSFDSSYRVRKILSASNGEQWVATLDHGLFKITPESFTHYKSDENDSRSIQDNQILDIYEDNFGLIWFATKENLSVTKTKPTDIENYYVSSDINFSLSGSDIFAIYISSDGNLLLGSHGSGIDLVTSEGVQNIELVDSLGVNISNNANAITIFDDVLYVATSKGFINSRDLKTFNRIELNEKPDNITLSIVNDEEKLYVATTRGLFSYHPESKQVTHFDSLGENHIWSITKFGNTFWVATSASIFQINSVGEILFSKSLVELSLDGDRIYDLNQISANQLAIGTRENGLVIYSLNLDRVEERLTESEGLPSNTIYTIAEDKNQDIWLSTHNGIAKVSNITRRVEILSTIEGLQSTEFNSGAFFKDSFGKFYYGGTQGVSAFYPHKMFTEKTIPNPIWSSIRTVVDGEYVEGSAGESGEQVIENDLYNTNKIELNYNDISTLEFSTSELIYSRDVTYLTKLSNTDLDAEWIKREADNRHLEISLLPAGDYLFEVKASVNGFDWSDPLSVNIIKHPPPWLTWWAYSIYFLFLLAIGSYIFQKRLQKSAEKHRVQKLIADSEERLKLALWGSRDELWDWNLVSGKIHRSNTWGILNFPKRETDDSGLNSIFRNIHPKDLPAVRAALDDHKNGYTSHYEATYRIKDKEDNWIWILDRGKIVEHDDGGTPLRMSGTIRNITDIRDTQEQLDLIAKAFENTSDGVFILDRDFKYQAVNKAYEKITGHKSSERMNRLFDIRNEYKESQDILHQIRQSLVLEKAWQGELEDTRANGEHYTIELKLDAVTDRLDDVSHYVGVFSDITYRKKAEQDLRRMANYDQLTGLPNRSLFQDRLKHAIELSDRSSRELILLFIDLDNFKVVNDSLGHSIGDKLLTKVAERISACVRSNDTVARLGGDEYTILLEQVEGAFVGTRVADKILEALARPFRIQGHELVIGCSIGIATYPDDGGDVETLLRNADTAMYSAKYMDKNNYQFFTDSMNKKANTRLEMEHELRKAIPAGDIKVAYQPKIDLENGIIMGCEALARWEHPDLGVVSPEDFIALAEETGLIYSLGEAVLNKACRATNIWKKQHGYSGRTAVNLSAMQFRQSGLVSIVDSILKRHQLDGDDIELEITEGMLVKNPESALKIMTDLRAKGMHLAIDDFGTGYASLAQLKNFPINTLKIDKAFIDDITTVEQDANVVKAILSLAENLGLNTVAEGVEESDQVEMLENMGCECIQGYVFSRPITEQEFAELLDKKLTLKNMIQLNNEKVVHFPAS